MNDKTKNLAPFNVAITGTSRGIGEQLVSQFINNTACNKIYCLSRHHSNLAALAGAKEKCIPVKLDLSKPETLTEQIKQSPLNEETRLNFLVNNAGYLSNKGFEEFNYAQSLALFNVNYFSPLALIKQLLPKIKQATPRHIINISSMAGFQGSVKFPGLVHYGASKGALAAATEILAQEFTSLQIPVNCLALGSVDTQMFSEAFPSAVAQTSASTIAEYVSNFLINGWKVANGKIFPLSLGTP